ncbi:MAG: septum site-determining protein MinC [Chloroflexota bacterium]|jgi:septum site-determining protein MinC
MRQTTESISIKGVRDGILIAVGEEESLDGIAAALEAELAAQKGFLAGSRVILSVGERSLTTTDIAPFQALLAGHDMTLWTVLAEREATREAARELALATRLPGSNADLNGNARQETAAAAGDPAPAQRLDGGANSLLLRETLRSGRSVYHEGHVVVIGDVNPGAEIIAGGDVVVWGKLRGLVHAGAHGDSAAVICALALNPTQLRIAGQIAVAPGEKRRRPRPEQVRLIDNQLVAEEWDAKH